MPGDEVLEEPSTEKDPGAEPEKAAKDDPDEHEASDEAVGSA